MPDNPDRSSSEATPQDPESAESPKPGTGREDAEGEDNDRRHHLLLHNLSERLHLPEDVKILDPRFRRYSHSYLIQAFLAAVTMLVILLFVDSLADAALAAGLGSSVVILFVHPSSPAAKARSVIGGHTLALLVGVGCSLLFFNSPLVESIGQSSIFSDVGLAASVGLVILIMAVTDTEHPPAAATVLGISMQPLDPFRVAVFIASIVLLAIIHFLLKSHLRDLI